MPVILNQTPDANDLAALKAYTPKFFNDVLTGSGKSIGILSQSLNPAALVYTPVTTSEHIYCKKERYTNGQTKVNKIPVNPLTPRAWRNCTKTHIPDKVLMAKMGELTIPGTGANAPNKTIEYWTQMLPHSIVMEETDNGPAGGGTQGANGTKVSNKTKKVTVCYQIFVYAIGDMHDTYARMVNIGDFDTISSQAKSLPTSNFGVFEFACDAVGKYAEIFTSLDNAGVTSDRQAIVDYLNNYSIYDAMVKRSEEWQTNITDTLDMLFGNLSPMVPQGYTYVKYDAQGNILPPTGRVLEVMTVMTEELEYLETYPIPLDLYRGIYTAIQKNFDPSLSQEFCKHNLNLLLSDTLYKLDAHRSNLTQMVLPANPKPPISRNGVVYSPEQARAISCTDPLVLVQSGAGTGKSLCNKTPVLTPTGWTTMGELKVGDLVIGSDGKPHKVLKIHEKGLLPGYHLTFRDGATVDACGEHLWTTHYIIKGEEHTRTITTEEWVNSRKYRNYDYLPIVQPVEYAFGEKNLPIDPYLLGALIADGSLSEKGSITYRKSNMDVVNEVKAAAMRDGYNVRETTEKNATARRWVFKHPDDNNGKANHLKTILRTLGLDVKSREKFIPDEYKTASVAQRKALLNGLFDGDGDIRTGRNYARFNTTSDQMAEDVLQLLWSLGLSATKQRQKHSRGDYWSVNLLDTSWDPFIASEYAGKAAGAVRPMRRSLTKAEPFDPVPMRCIEVDAPDKLYVVKDFIVTHNSSVILGRVDWMISNGVDPKDIMIISFTNAAADHIMSKNPYIQSMTIAKMIHTIYSLNFPQHELSTAETLSNTIDIYFPNDPLANQFRKRVSEMENKRNNDIANAYTQMNNFVERNLNGILALLDAVHQTTLELEIIICYQMINQLKEPPEIASRYLIIDEVQDNSVFEFIYALKYVEKHNEALFIVGKN